MKHLYFIRHGQSVMNVQELFAGSTDTPLTEDGKKGARLAGQNAKKEGIHIDLIISSPLQRAHTTAQLFAEGAGLPADIIHTNILLKERNFGVLEGQPWTAGSSMAMIDDDLPEGVESWSELIKRANELIRYIEHNPADNILLVGHGAIGRAVRAVVEPSADVHAGIPNSELVRWI